MTEEDHSRSDWPPMAMIALVVVAVFAVFYFLLGSHVRGAPSEEYGRCAAHSSARIPGNGEYASQSFLRGSLATQHHAVTVYLIRDRAFDGVEQRGWRMICRAVVDGNEYSDLSQEVAVHVCSAFRAYIPPRFAEHDRARQRDFLQYFALQGFRVGTRAATQEKLCFNEFSIHMERLRS